MNTPPDFTTYTRDHWTCLLDIERRAVDSEGMVGRITEAELEAIQRFERDGLIDAWTHTLLPIKLTARGWAVTHEIRRARAEGVDRERWPTLAAFGYDDAVAPARRMATTIPTFDEVWAAKEAEGYQYGPDALEGVRFGWRLYGDAIAGKYRAGGASSKVVIAGLG